MRVDLTLQVDAKNTEEITSRQSISAFGHLGTHIDLMGKSFSLDKFSRRGRLIDVSSVTERDIEVGDFKGVEIEEMDFALIYTGFTDRVSYGSHAYFKTHPALSMEAIEFLLQKKVSLIGIDAAGLMRGEDHPEVDRVCVEHNVFVVENLVNLKALSCVPIETNITVYTLAVNIEGLTGVPCRVIAEF